MMVDYGFNDEPCYVISVAARMVGVHAQTLRYYERVGLVEPLPLPGKAATLFPQGYRSAAEDQGPYG